MVLTSTEAQRLEDFDSIREKRLCATGEGCDLLLSENDIDEMGVMMRKRTWSMAGRAQRS